MIVLCKGARAFVRSAACNGAGAPGRQYALLRNYMVFAEYRRLSFLVCNKVYASAVANNIFFVQVM